MNTAVTLTKTISIALFLYYGISCVFAEGMEAEFERFGLSRFRKLTGILELIGAVGLLVGFLYPSVDVAAAGGLSLLMLLGLVVRVRLKDSFLDMLPAIVLLAVNTFILVAQSKRLVAPPLP